ncbi:MAG: GAF domain-containing protein [Chloroflexi bacterium]|nr:GAF domain-containing protein [Chloroflexota bacterium]
MSAPNLLTAATQAIILLLAILTLVDFLRHRDQARLDVMLMLGDLATIVLIQLLTSAAGGAPREIMLLGAILLIAHPYFLLRLVEHFRPVSRRLHAFAVVGLAVSSLLLLAVPAPLPAIITLPVIAYFVFVEGYATVAFVRGAWTTSGVTHWRMLLAALGSGLIAALILVLGIAVAFPEAAPVVRQISQLLSVSAIGCYYFGFATPLWLRRSWQLAELRRFLAEPVKQRMGAEMTETLERLCSASVRATGGLAASVVFWNAAETALVVRAATDARLAGEWSIGEGALWRAWRGCAPAVIGPAKNFDAAEAGLLAKVNAGAALAIPIATTDRSWGLLLVFTRRVPLFATDDLALLALFSEQTAIVLGYAAMLGEQQALIAQLRQSNLRLEAESEIDRAILAARSPRKIAHAALAHLRQLVPCDRASVVTLEAQQQRARWIASENAPGLASVEGMSIPRQDFVAFVQPRGTRPAVYLDDLFALADPPPILRVALDEGLSSMLLIPLIADNILIGGLVLSSRQVAAFQPEQQAIARQVADQMAIALEQARLRDELEGHAHELESRVTERTAELENSNRELEAFSYSVSHDLRAPLASIDGFSRIVLDDFGPQLPDEAQRFLNLIHQNAVAAGELIDGLLRFSRLSRQALNQRTVAPADLVRQVLDDLASQQDGRHVEVVIGELPECEADPVLLKQVWVNLISNALKFTRQRAVAKLEIGSQACEGEEVAYFVKDNGVGFDREQADKLFGVFQRYHDAEDYEGTGVGLAIVERIVRRHGGRVWAEAQVDQGATFYFTLGRKAEISVGEIREV